MAEAHAVKRTGSTLDLRPVLTILGFLICGTGVLMIVPAMFDLATGSGSEAFEVAAAVALGLGVMLITANRGCGPLTTLRQTYLLTFLAWLLVPGVAALPLVFSSLQMTFTDAFFETMSGMTTTGSTVLIGLDELAPSVLLWRGLLQWVGGLGIIVMAIAIMPLLRSGGMQLFHAESSDRSDKPLARVSQLAFSLCAVYFGLTVVCAFAYRLAGMTWFDAAVHSMTTLSTGGYSNHDASFGYFASASIDWIAIVFMLAGAVPFLLILRAARGDGASLVHDQQVRIMLLVALLTAAALAVPLVAQRDIPIDQAVREAAFNVTSILTTTGFASTDYGTWGPFATATFFYLMFIGGCTGSTSGAIKIFRFQVLYIVLSSYTLHRFTPHLVISRTYGDKPLSQDVAEGVMAFLALYFATVGLIAVVLGALGLDWLTALSGAVQAVGNIGPGLGEAIGPAGNFAGLPDGAKWALVAGMLSGRLELFTVLVVLTPSFWK
ncbi:MAG TPA: TrkH family potassium uptake protein [Geminicoccaceae bacterium]